MNNDNNAMTSTIGDSRTFNVKCDFEGDVRRFSIAATAADVDALYEGLLANLISQLKDAYGMEPTVLKYVDDEGDLVTLSNKQDLKTARTICPTLLRVVVQGNTPAPEEDAMDSEDKEDETDEANTTCRDVNYVLKNGNRCVLKVRVSELVALSFPTQPAELEEAVNDWKLGQLVHAGLVTVSHAREVCEANNVKVPKAKLWSHHHHGHHGHHPHGPPHHHGPHHGPPHQPHEGGPHGHWKGRGRGRGRGHHGHGHRGHHFGRGRGWFHPFAHHHHGHGPEDGPSPPPAPYGPMPPHHPHHRADGDEVLGTDFKKHWKIRAKMTAKNAGNIPGGFNEHAHDDTMDDNDDQTVTATEVASESGCHGRHGRVMARFVKHVTVPDNEPVVCGSSVVKTWRVRNDSSAAWPVNCELIAVGGETTTLVTSNAAPTRGNVQPGCETDISVTVIAPDRPGFVQGFWRLRDADTHKKFGQRLWVSMLATQSSSDEEDFVAVAVVSGDDDLDEDPSVAVAAKQLQEMGFVDSALNHRLLHRFRGNVERAVEHLSKSQ